MQCNPVPTSILNYNRNKPVTSVGISTLQFGKSKSLFVSGFQFERNGFKHLPSLRYMLGAFNVLLNSVCTHMSRRSDIVRRRPKMPSPQPFLKNREANKQPSTRSTFEDFHSIGNGNRRRNAQKQVDVVRLNFSCQYSPLSFGANLIQKFFKCFSHFTSQNVVPVLRTPHKMVSSLIHTISVCSNVFHTSHSIPCDAACQAAIPPLVEIRGFLAGVL